MDEDLEMSYDGSDAVYYYELKDYRAERKRDLLEQQRANKKEREQQTEFENTKEKRYMMPTNLPKKPIAGLRRRARQSQSILSQVNHSNCSPRNMSTGFTKSAGTQFMPRNESTSTIWTSISRGMI